MTNTKQVNASGTIYIRSDGRIDPATAPILRLKNTYILVNDVYERIMVERSDIIIDGNRCTIHGWSEIGLEGIRLSDVKNVTVQNINIKDFTEGAALYIHQSTYCRICGNSMTNNAWGVFARKSCNNVLCNNNITYNEFGIWIYETSSNYNISRNRIVSNGFGIYLSSSYDSFDGNILDNNDMGFYVAGSNMSHFMHSISNSNLVNGKPVHYLVSKQDLTAEYFSKLQIGYLALVNCTRVAVQNLSLSNNGQGILLAYTNNSRITNNSLAYNSDGIFLFSAYNNDISENIMSGGWDAMKLWNSANNSVYKNNMINNAYGIVLSGSKDNTFFENRIADNYVHSMWIDASALNRFYHNNFINNAASVFSKNCTNIWDNGYPLGGNYWSDHTGPDLAGGQFQNLTESDGIIDWPYVIDEENQDSYPLAEPFDPLITRLRVQYYDLLKSYTELTEKYSALRLAYNITSVNYEELMKRYDSQIADYTALQEQYNALNTTYSQLLNNYNSIIAMYNTLNDTCNELILGQRETCGQLDANRRLLYVFVSTTFILGGVTLYLTKRKKAI